MATRGLTPARARELIQKAVLPEVIEAAIDALRDDPGLRELLVARYEKIRANPVKLDGGAGVRVALLQALRPIARSSDLAIFEGAVLVVEIGYGKDVAQNLRAAALFGIAELDPRLAAWYGARLLQDRRHVSEVTGEPALSAARVLAMLGRPEAVYLEALRGGAHPEVRSECIRQLGSMPPPLLVELAAETFKGTDEPAMLGLIDLALAHAELAQVLPQVREFMAVTERLDVYRYLVTAGAASRREEMISLLREERGRTSDRQKFRLLEGALELLA